MSKFIDKPVKVTSTHEDCPLRFLYDGRWIAVRQTLDLWKDTGTWWDGEAEKVFHRIESIDGSLYELYQDSGSQTWFLYRIYD